MAENTKIMHALSARFSLTLQENIISTDGLEYAQPFLRRTPKAELNILRN